MSEFHIPHLAFWFEWDLPRIFLLVAARVERNERSKAENDNSNSSRPNGSFQDLQGIMAAGF